MSQLSRMVEGKRAQWNLEAEMGFCRVGRDGGKLVRQLWANGSVMVGPEGGLPNRFIPLERAIELWRNGWRIYI